MEAYIAVEGEGPQSCGYTQATEDINACLLKMETMLAQVLDINACLLKMETMLAQVLIKERDEQEQASRACQAGKKAKQTGQPPLPSTHRIETEQGQKQEQRLVISGSKKEG